MIESLTQTFVLLFVVIDPPGIAAIFAAMTSGIADAEVRRIALRGTLIAAAVLVAFAFGGGALLRALAVGIPAFQIAGGLLLFTLAVDMLFGRHSGMKIEGEHEDAGAGTRDMAVFPLAIPLIAGPGAMTTLLLRGGQHGEDWLRIAALIGVLLLVLALTWLALRAAQRIVRVLGETGLSVLTRVFGIILAALAVQYVIDGIGASFPAMRGGA